jgi:hypothetical protein
VDAWSWAKALSGAKTKAALYSRQHNREQLGTGAEEAAFDHEKKRVGPEWAGHVDYVSKHHPLSNFDIRSVTVDKEGHAVTRFIEVKAVSPDSYRFFWSSGEVEIAKILGPSYFLYLVPIVQNQGFDVENIWMIGNAYEAICEDPTKWTIESDVLLCQPRDINPH